MATFTPTFTDDFDRADGGLGANWTRSSGASDRITIVSNAANKSVGGSSGATHSPNSQPGLVDRYVAVTLGSGTSANSDGATISDNGVNNKLFFRIDNGANIYITERVSGTNTDIAGPAAVVSGDLIVGYRDQSTNDLVVEINAVEALSAVSAIESGSPTMGMAAIGTGTGELFTYYEHGTWVETATAPDVTDCNVQASLVNTTTTTVTSFTASQTYDGVILEDVATGAGAPTVPLESDPRWTFPVQTDFTLSVSGIRDVWAIAKNGADIGAWFLAGTVDSNIVKFVYGYSQGQPTPLVTYDIDNPGGFDPEAPEIDFTGLNDGVSYLFELSGESTKGVEGPRSAAFGETTTDGTAPTTNGEAVSIQALTIVNVDMPTADDNFGVDHLELNVDVDGGGFSLVSATIPHTELLSGGGTPLGVVRYVYDASAHAAGTLLVFQYRAVDFAGNASAYVTSSVPVDILGAPGTMSVTFVPPATIRISGL